MLLLIFNRIASSCFATPWCSKQASQQRAQGYTDPAFSSQSSLSSCSLPSFQSSLTSVYSISDDSALTSGLDHFPENFMGLASPKEEGSPPAKRRAEISECAEHRAAKQVTDKKVRRKKESLTQRVVSIRHKKEGINKDASNGSAVSTCRYMLRGRSKINGESSTAGHR
ncbi:unnamed protein product [Cylicocyclus nassatus]|uniref:Uncharacterized protein n=1 Tax=Cylicocyclus nassatus TaxID=53992 RepID=A0AA36H4B1_CYLNA|nr:unnamed protein product [Cylicocyclus nassatus]